MHLRDTTSATTLHKASFLGVLLGVRKGGCAVAQALPRAAGLVWVGIFLLSGLGAQAHDPRHVA